MQPGPTTNQRSQQSNKTGQCNQSDWLSRPQPIRLSKLALQLIRGAKRSPATNQSCQSELPIRPSISIVNHIIKTYYKSFENNPFCQATTKPCEEKKPPRKYNQYKNQLTAVSEKAWVIHDTWSFLFFSVHVFERKYGQNYLVYVRVGEKALIGLLFGRYS